MLHEQGDVMHNRYLSLHGFDLSMSSERLGKDDVERIVRFVGKHDASLALIRTEMAPTELVGVLKSLGRACGLSLTRNAWSPSSDFGFAELNSKGKMLVILYVGGERTELISVSETDEVFVRELEESISSSNFCSEIVRQGL
jgi:hypothetical protein